MPSFATWSETSEFLKMDLRKPIPKLTKLGIKSRRHGEFQAKVLPETRGLAGELPPGGPIPLWHEGCSRVCKQVLFLIFLNMTFVVEPKFDVL